MTQANNPSNGFGPQDFHGWPEVPPAERLERAIFHVQDNYDQMMAAGGLIPSGDSTLDQDIVLCAASMHNSTLGKQIEPAQMIRFAADGELTTLASILCEQETEDSFAAAIIEDDTPDGPGQQTLIGVQHIFAMLREEGWMGLSPHLSQLENTHLHALESHQTPGRISALIAVPTRLMTPDVPPPGPVPDGEPARLRDIAQWHGALSFHWIQSRR